MTTEESPQSPSSTISAADCVAVFDWEKSVDLSAWLEWALTCFKSADLQTDIVSCGMDAHKSKKVSIEDARKAIGIPVFPTFILHSDCDGEWSVAECQGLQGELAQIVAALKARSGIRFSSAWQEAVAKSIGLNPQNAFESFIDVDGEFLLERLQNLVKNALARGLPILFQ